jgi:predicted Abi (CAAX) family protease
MYAVFGSRIHRLPWQHSTQTEWYYRNKQSDEYQSSFSPIQDSRKSFIFCRPVDVKKKRVVLPEFEEGKQQRV